MQRQSRLRSIARLAQGIVLRASTLRRAAVAAAALLVASAAAAAPPPDAGDRYRTWFSELRTKDGGSCCDVADCRFVGERIVGNGYQVRFHEPGDAFPTGWVPVPDDAVRPRPPGGPPTAVACWLKDRVYCFFGEPES